MPHTPHRLLIRSDFDGLVCAMLLKHAGRIGEVVFVHPKDVQDGRVAINEGDITANLPYVPGVHLAFDNHVSEAVRQGAGRPNHVIDPASPSTARVVYEYLGGIRQFPAAYDEMLAAVDKSETGDFSIDDVLHPKGWELLSFLMDARTGLGRFRSFRISNYRLMQELIDHCTELPIDEILELTDVSERVELYFDEEERFQAQLRRATRLHGDLALLDLRGETVIHAGNRYMIFALFPESAVSLHVLWGLRRDNTVFAAGHSIFNRGCPVSIGELMLRYGGGGHRTTGTCQVENGRAAKVLGELVEQLRSR